MSHEGETPAGPLITCTPAAQHEGQHGECWAPPRAVSSAALAMPCHRRAARTSAAAHTGLCWLSTPGEAEGPLQHPPPWGPRAELPCSSGGSAHHRPCCVPKTRGCSPRRAPHGAVEPQTQTRAHIVSRSFIACTQAGQGSQLIPGFRCPKWTRLLPARAVLRGLGHLEKAAVRHGWTHPPA